MNKQEIIEAINSTIMPNGQKGITAEALANILVEMANASGGGGAGAVVYVGTADVSTGAFSQTAEQKLHNAEVFQLVKSSESPVSLFVDTSDTYALEGLAVKSYISCTVVMYLSEDSAPLLGLQSEAVMIGGTDVAGNGELMLLPDGTVESMPTE